ncbi:hypothetical protein M011DRAFT_443271 [Sporormia fimetaria CBS 119925]|uniref:Septin-type G domain-containing protein n=1 Tax=Sporormia fimetaria CBS 119925 TaxID=1340428 RepID=A0A6A6VE67_9PLEO|nr:hypothetical protein M011DRAFT_443271 [Sporormia fimetaria CBS 119925]
MASSNNNNTTTPTRSHRPPPSHEGSPDPSAVPKIQPPHSNGDQNHAAAGPRRSSFNFLRRKSSSETRNGHRSVSGGKMSKKAKALAQEEALRKQREAAMLPKLPPQLPSHSPLPRIDNFGGGIDDGRPDSVAIISNRAGSYNLPRPSAEYRGAPAHSGPAPPLPANAASFMDYDPYPASESMTNRGRYSYASSAVSAAVNNPRRVRRRKDPTPFNILVLGSKSCGKTSFIELLRTALALPAKKRAHTPSPPVTAAVDPSFTSEYIESEFDGERIGVTLWDSEGLEKSIVDFQLPLITKFLESKFEDTFTEEQKVIRAPGVRDTHIHCVFLILDPARLDANLAAVRKKGAESGITGGLDDNLDLNVLRGLQGKTTVIPVISKADTITTAHMRFLKKTVWETIKRARLDPLEALHLVDEEVSESEDEDVFDERDEDAYVNSDSEKATEQAGNPSKPRTSSSDADTNPSLSSSPSGSPTTSPNPKRKSHARKPSAMSISMQSSSESEPYLPLSIISPDPYDPSVVGRKFPWGFADPYNPDHCDFVRLRESVFSEWRGELREASREQWYEGWRTNRLQRGPSRKARTADGPVANGGATSMGGA